MRQTALDSPYDRNQMQTLFAMLADVRVQTPVAKPKRKSRAGSKPLFALWWQKLMARRRMHAVAARAQQRPSGLVNPQRAASPLVPRTPVRWRAPAPDGSAQFFALLDEMGARHQAAARRDHLITALETSITRRRLES